MIAYTQRVAFGLEYIATSRRMQKQFDVFPIYFDSQLPFKTTLYLKIIKYLHHNPKNK